MDYVLTPAGEAALSDLLTQRGLLNPLVQSVGLHLPEVLAAHLPPPAPDLPTLVVVAGSGRNGAYALATARILYAMGYSLRVLVAAGKEQTPERRVAYTQLKKAVPEAIQPLTARNWQQALSMSRQEAVLIGLDATEADDTALSKLLATTITQAGTQASIKLLSVNQGMEHAHTLAIGYLSSALLFGPDAPLPEHLEIVPAALPAEVLAQYAAATRLSDAELSSYLPHRRVSAHKGEAGRVWLVGGHKGTQGAPLLSAYAALRTGAGLVTVYSEVELPLLHPEVMLQVGLPPEPPAGKHFAVALGMGLGPQAAQHAQEVLRWQVPTVLDADALQPTLAGQGHAQVIWTPHPGEAARLLGYEQPGREVAAISVDPLQAAQDLQRRYGGVVILKGGPSTIATPDALYVVRGGHPGMATAGMGDTLSSILAALLAAGLDATHAALVGTRLHALAGELAAQQYHYSLMASDVSEQLGQAWLQIQAASITK